MGKNKNFKINTNSNFSFTINGKKINSMEDLPKSLQILGTLFGANTDYVKAISKRSSIEKMATLMKDNPEFLTLLKSGKLKFDSSTRTLSYNGKVINLLEEIPAPLRPIAKKLMEDKNADNVPDIVEGILNKTNTQVTNEVAEVAVEDKNNEIKPWSNNYTSPNNLPKAEDNKIIENKPINVAGNPLGKLQAILIGLIALGIVLYFFTS